MMIFSSQLCSQQSRPFIGIETAFSIQGMTDKPTHTDVLLGRGVATNRHPGNENFRAIVSQHVGVYATSTKKEKMLISRSIVDYIHTKLRPSGRFLEKDARTGLWQEVEDRRALEKTAQALRDGAAPLRKRISNDGSDCAFLNPSPDGTDGSSGKLPLSKFVMHENSSGNRKKHRRTKTSPLMEEVLSSGSLQSQRKKSRSNPDFSRDAPTVEVLERLQQLSQSAQQQMAQANGRWLEHNRSSDSYAPMKALFGQSSSINHRTESIITSHSGAVSTLKFAEISVSNSATMAMNYNGGLHSNPKMELDRGGVSATLQSNHFRQESSKNMWEHNPTQGGGSGFDVSDDFEPLPWKPLAGTPANVELPQKLASNDDCGEIPISGPIFSNSDWRDNVSPLLSDENAIDNADFAREMGNDEDFFELGDFRPIDGSFDVEFDREIRS